MDPETRINLELVAHGLRDAFLPNSQTPEQESVQYAQSLGVYYLPTSLGFNLFVKNPLVATQVRSNQQLGRALGFYCANHLNFHNENIPRYGVSVKETTTNTQVFAEFCEASRIKLDELTRHYQEKVNRFNQTLPQYNFAVEIKYEPSRQEYLNNRSYDFFNLYRDEYLNILANYWFTDSRFHHLMENLDQEGFNRYWDKILIFLNNIYSWFPIMQKYTSDAINEHPELSDEDAASYYPIIRQFDESLWNFFGMNQ